MFSLRRPGVIEVEGEGRQPYKSYKVDVHAETFVQGSGNLPVRSPGPHSFRIETRAGYPRTDAPVVTFTTATPWHINVYGHGQLCIGRWNGMTETLASLTVRTIRVLLLDKATFNFDSIANHSCEDFCRAHHEGLPKDFQLPCPDFDI
jgi:viroplasmin and RNaseH domain-containing protein